MKQSFISNSSKDTKELGKILAKELRGGEIFCLSGNLGSGKTTFSQGILEGLGAKGPHTSPTFVVLRHYRLKAQSVKTKVTTGSTKPKNAYHIDAYRVRSQDLINLGWEEIIASKSNIVIVEWAERIKKIIPKGAIWIRFEHIKDDGRKIIIGN